MDYFPRHRLSVGGWWNHVAGKLTQRESFGDQHIADTTGSFSDLHIAQRLSMVNGVAQIQVFGEQKYAVRVYLDPEALSKRALGLDKVVSAIQNANSNLPAGVLQGQTRTFTVKSSGKLERARHFSDLIVAYSNGMPVRLSDIGRAEDSIENTHVKAALAKG